MSGYSPCPFCGSIDIESDAGLIMGVYCPGCMECGALAPLAQWNVRKLADTEQSGATKLYQESEARLYQILETKRLDIAAQLLAALCAGEAQYSVEEAIESSFSMADKLIERSMSV